MKNLPSVRGTLTFDKALANLTWMRVGGAADVLFQPADVQDLADFLRQLPADIPVFPLGVGSNLIVRDGGIRGVVIKLGREFAGLEVDGTTLRAGAAAGDAIVARKAAKAGLDLTFLRTIPGAIGGAVKMNAGCYGAYVSDALQEITLVTRAGNIETRCAVELGFGYRVSNIPDDAVIIEAVFKCPTGEADDLEARMIAQIAKRDASQPTKDRTAGSTFRNPLGASSTGIEGENHDLKAWKVIDDAGMRGAQIGGAIINQMHSNFLTNSGTATAADLENLGELVRERVLAASGILLEWEIMRIGDVK